MIVILSSIVVYVQQAKMAINENPFMGVAKDLYNFKYCFIYTM